MENILFLLEHDLNREVFDLPRDEDIWLNLHGDYTYMTEGYYLSLDAEVSGKIVHPSTQEIMDAYIASLALEKARLGGIPVLEGRIINFPHDVRPPIMAYPINPFSTGYEIVETKEEIDAKIKRVTMSGKYAAHVQQLPQNFRIDTVRCIMGRTLVNEYNEFADQVFRVFRLPLMKIKTVVTTQCYMLSSIEPLPHEDLTLNEKKILEGMGSWRK
jgi:hypothetical protein